VADEPLPGTAFSTHKDQAGHTLHFLNPHAHCPSCRPCNFADPDCDFCSEVLPWAKDYMKTFGGKLRGFRKKASTGASPAPPSDRKGQTVSILQPDTLMSPSVRRNRAGPLSLPIVGLADTADGTPPWGA
jgi:hypothetical protein